jgi:hypothetical protein
MVRQRGLDGGGEKSDEWLRAVTGRSRMTVRPAHSATIDLPSASIDSDDTPYPKRFLLLGMLLFKDILPILALDHPFST